MFLAVIEARRPDVFYALVYGYAALWFSTPFWIASLIGLARHDRRLPHAPRPRGSADCQPYPQPETRPAPSLVLGEAHHATRPGRAPEPTWLTIPQRGLYTGRHDSWRGRDRKDVRLHVSLRGPAASVAARRCRPQGRRPGDGSEGRLLPAGAGHPRRTHSGPTTTSRLGSTQASATTRCTTTSIRTPSPTRSPRC